MFLRHDMSATMADHSLFRDDDKTYIYNPITSCGLYVHRL